MSLGANFAQLTEDLPPADVRHVLGVFEADVRRLVGALASAAAEGDSGRFRRQAHALAGAAGVVGASGLEAACRAQMARTDAADPAAMRENARAIALWAETALADVAAFVARMDRRHGGP